MAKKKRRNLKHPPAPDDRSKRPADTLHILPLRGNLKSHDVVLISPEENAALFIEAKTLEAPKSAERESPWPLMRAQLELAWRTNHRRLSRANTILDTWGALLPTRIYNEDLGDLIEDVKRRCAAGQRVRVWLRVSTGILWTALNAVGYAMRLLRAKRVGR